VAGCGVRFAGRFAGLDADTLYGRLLVLLERLDARTEPLLEGVARFEHEAIMAFAADGGDRLVEPAGRATTVGPSVGGRVEMRIGLAEQEPEPTVAVAGDRVDRATL